MTTRTKRQRAVYILLLCLIAIAIVLSDLIPLPVARADADLSSSYDKTNAYDDLKGSQIGGEPFDLADYPKDDKGDPRLILFTEYCYSTLPAKQAYFGLYVYIYNPSEKSIDESSVRNKVQLKIGTDGKYVKRDLVYLNHSTDKACEKRFYKFRVGLSHTELAAVLNGLTTSERVYEISGVELSYGGNVAEHTCAQKYTYSGYAAGCDPDGSNKNTLKCTVDGFDRYLTLDVKSTYWRPKGTHADGYTRDTLHSVYFSVPNKIIDEYGKMTGVHATWLNAYTAPILVTGNMDIYNALQKHLGKYVYGGTREDMNSNTDLVYALVATMAAEGVRDDVEMAPYGGYYAYNQYVGMKSGQTNYLTAYDKVIYYLHYLFYADNGNADTFMLPAEALIGDDDKDGWFKTYTDRFGGELINDRYSRALFDIVDENFTDVQLTNNDEYTLTDKTVSDTVWNRLFGSTVQHETSYTMSAIQKVTMSEVDYYTDRSAFCDNFYIAESDYFAFTDYVRESAAKDETVFLFRYYQSEYRANEVTEYSRTTKWYIGSGDLGVYEYVDTNAYFAQMWVQLDFDIIDLTFTKYNVVTVVPVVASPIDIVADVDHPVSVQPEQGKDKIDWRLILKIACGVIIGICVLWLLNKLGLLPLIGSGIAAVVTAPYKLISGAVKKRKKKKPDNSSVNVNVSVPKENKTVKTKKQSEDEK